MSECLISDIIKISSTKAKKYYSDELINTIIKILSYRFLYCIVQPSMR